MTASQGTEADFVHISGGLQMLWAAVSRRPQRALCGFNLEGDDLTSNPLAGICRTCAKRAKWTEAQVAEMDEFWSAP